MHYLAPLAIVLGLSGALYKTKEVFNKTEYDLYIEMGWAKQVAEDAGRLTSAVKRGVITGAAAKEMLSRKWSGPQGVGGPQLSTQQQEFLSQVAMAQAERQKAVASAAQKN